MHWKVLCIFVNFSAVGAIVKNTTVIEGWRDNS